ncbi:hypothetical protein P4O66_011407 [Electrophorus voltai]|uniref:Transmembrane protein 54a n=1 Tax=Electrophorus voltai TaxID=2609070 RepID=A0AAD8Z627_9TELE|nr:hypothetical protein P4O66_011407 [Electrophorus voltai]
MTFTFLSPVCCRNLKDTKILMKTGLGLVLAGHVNFLLGALVHGAVLRNVSVSVQAATMEYAIANIIALTAGLTVESTRLSLKGHAAIGGISAIVLSKNMKNKSLVFKCWSCSTPVGRPVGLQKWLLLVMSLLACLLGCASAVSVFASMVTAISNSGLSLLTQCNLNGTVNTYSITYECPFDPTRIYGTTLTLWVLVIIMSLVEVAFSGRCFVACTAFLRLPCPWRKMPVNANRVRFRTTEDCNQAASSYAPDVEEPTEENDLLNTTTPTEETSELEGYGMGRHCWTVGQRGDPSGSLSSVKRRQTKDSERRRRGYSSSTVFHSKDHSSLWNSETGEEQCANTLE